MDEDLKLSDISITRHALSFHYFNYSGLLGALSLALPGWPCVYDESDISAWITSCVVLILYHNFQLDHRIETKDVDASDNRHFLLGCRICAFLTSDWYEIF
jgi:hypothetical protein